MKKRVPPALGALLILSLLISACNLPLPQTEVPDLAATAVQQTLVALATQQGGGGNGGSASPQPPGDTPPPPPAATDTPAPPPDTPVAPSPTPGVEGCTDRAAFVADVTVPDGADFTPGQTFTKTWRLRNAGSCTWTSSYALVFSHGDQLGGPAEVPLAGAVPPGSTVDLSVNLTAPASVGSFQGFWKLRNGSGVLFGIGSGGNTAFWVKIDVPATPTPSSTPTATPTGLIIQPPIIITIFPLFVSKGTDQVLGRDYCFDLDAGAQVGCGSGSADFSYGVTASGFPPSFKYRISPRNGATFGAYGNDLPSSSDCQATAMSVSGFNVQTKVYCYKTSNGKYGYLKVKSRDFTSIVFDWGTYSLP